MLPKRETDINTFYVKSKTKPQPGFFLSGTANHPIVLDDDDDDLRAPSYPPSSTSSHTVMDDPRLIDNDVEVQVKREASGSQARQLAREERKVRLVEYIEAEVRALYEEEVREKAGIREKRRNKPAVARSGEASEDNKKKRKRGDKDANEKTAKRSKHKRSSELRAEGEDDGLVPSEIKAGWSRSSRIGVHVPPFSIIKEGRGKEAIYIVDLRLSIDHYDAPGPSASSHTGVSPCQAMYARNDRRSSKG